MVLSGFHFTSAKPRDGLASFACRSLTSTSHLSFSSIDHLALLSSSFSSLIELASSSHRTHLHLLVLLPDLWAYSRKLAEKKAGKIEELFYLLSSFSFILSSSQIFCLPVMRVGHSRRIVLFSERQTNSCLITSGLDSSLRRAFGRDKETRIATFESICISLYLIW